MGGRWEAGGVRRGGGQERQVPPQSKANKKTEHKIFALYLGVRGPGQRDTSRGPQAGARTREISTRLRKPPQRTAHPMTNRPQLITQGCLRRVAPGPAPKKTFDNPLPGRIRKNTESETTHESTAAHPRASRSRGSRENDEARQPEND